MLNNNFKKIMSVCAPFPSASGVSLKLTNGRFLNGVVSVNFSGKTYSFANVKYNTAASSYSGNTVVFGDSDQPATLEDYKIVGNVIPNLVASVATVKSDENITARFTITNNNSTEITIKEVCYVASATYYSANWGSNNLSVVIDRTVLDTPVTIPAGGVGQVEYTITFNLPTAT